MNPQQREAAIRLANAMEDQEAFAMQGTTRIIRLGLEAAALLRSLAEDPPAKQEPLTQQEIDLASVALEYPNFARAIEAACAKKWGVSLG